MAIEKRSTINELDPLGALLPTTNFGVQTNDGVTGRVTAGQVRDLAVAAAIAAIVAAAPDDRNTLEKLSAVLDALGLSLADLAGSLGTAAVLNVGTAANQIVQLDAQGRLPAVDASLLTKLRIGFKPQGRLTLVSGAPVLTSTQATKTTLYYTPSEGNMVPIWNGSAFVARAFSELSVLTTDTTKSPAAIGANKINDWFVWDDAGTLRLSHGPDWAAANLRGVGNGLTMQGGLWVNDTAITHGPAAGYGTYVGTTMSDGSAGLSWQYGVSGTTPLRGFFGLWNAYNRRSVATMFSDTTATYNYAGGGTIRQANAGAHGANQVAFVVGLIDSVIEADYAAFVNVNASPVGAIGIGLNVTNAFSGPVSSITTAAAVQNARFVGLPGLGVNTIYALEAAGSTSTITVQSGGANYQGGLSFKGDF